MSVSTTAAPIGTLEAMKKALFLEITKQAGAIAKAKGMNNITPIDQGLTGGLPWYHDNAGTFNENTYKWLNHVWKYNPDGYVEADGAAFSTAYFNVIQGIIYQLSATDQAKLNKENTANSVILSTVLSNYTTAFGPFPATDVTPAAKSAFLMKEVLSWAPAGTTLDDLRKSLSPTTLLSAAPLGTDTLINNLMTYLGKTSGVAHLQSQVMINMAELTAIMKNLVPMPAAAGDGWMNASDQTGVPTIVPELAVSPSLATIQSALDGKGTGFSVSMTLDKTSSSTADMSVEGGAKFGASFGDLFSFGSSVSSSYDCFSVDTSTTNCTITMSFDGLTTFTPEPLGYDVSKNYGWWAPNVIKDANIHSSTDAGYVFGTTRPSINFGKDGDFGYLKNLLISNPPTMKIEYSTADYSSITKNIDVSASAGVSILGIDFGGGSSSYYKSDVQKNASGTGVVITMEPDIAQYPVPNLLQEAFVIGADVYWLGE